MNHQDAGFELVHFAVALEGQAEEIGLVVDGEAHVAFECAGGELFGDLVEDAIEDEPPVFFGKADERILFGGFFDALGDQIEHGFVGEDAFDLAFEKRAQFERRSVFLFGGLGIKALDLVESEQKDGFEFFFLPRSVGLPLAPVPASQNTKDRAKEFEEEIKEHGKESACCKQHVLGSCKRKIGEIGAVKRGSAWRRVER